MGDQGYRTGAQVVGSQKKTVDHCHGNDAVVYLDLLRDPNHAGSFGQPKEFGFAGIHNAESSPGVDGEPRRPIVNPNRYEKVVAGAATQRGPIGGWCWFTGL